MNGVHANINRPLGANEIVESPSPLRRKVYHRSATRRTVGHQLVRWKLVRRIDESAGSLEPGLESPRLGIKIPAQNDRRQAHAAIRAAAFRS